MASVRIPLWHCTRDPALVAFLQRGARDTGLEPVDNPRPGDLDSGERVALDRELRRAAFAALSADIGRGDRFAARVLEDA